MKSYLKKFGAFARNSDPDTSKKAAAKIDTSTLEMAVYRVIASHGNRGCTSDEIINSPVMANISYGAITPRYAVLLRKKLIEDTGERRKAASGRYQRVMRVNK